MPLEMHSLDCIGKLLKQGRKDLAPLGPEEAKASAERLLEDTLSCERTFLYSNGGDPVSKKQAARFHRLILKRKARVPVAYLLQKAYFWNEVLEVRPGCLIPRPETEILVDSFIRDSGFQKHSSFSFLDLGSGSGAIGIALLRHFPNACATFADISRKALGITKKNLIRHGLLSRTRIVCSDLFERFSTRAENWDAIISNPPYVAWKDLAGLEPELKREPVLALDGGEDGLDFYRKITRGAKAFLSANALLVFEMGAGQSRQIAALASENGFSVQKIVKDYSNIERVLMARVSLKAD